MPSFFQYTMILHFYFFLIYRCETVPFSSSISINKLFSKNTVVIIFFKGCSFPTVNYGNFKTFFPNFVGSRFLNFLGKVNIILFLFHWPLFLKSTRKYNFPIGDL